MFSIKLKIFIACIIVCFNAAAQSPASTIPSFTFFRLDKTPFTEKNIQAGKMAFIVFFDAECEHCQHAIKEINEHYKGNRSTPLYLISLDTKEKIIAFLDKYGTNLKNNKNVNLLQDTKSEFIARFTPRKYPSMFLYSAKKNLLIYTDDEKKLGGFWKIIKLNCSN